LVFGQLKEKDSSRSKENRGTDTISATRSPWFLVILYHQGKKSDLCKSTSIFALEYLDSKMDRKKIYDRNLWWPLVIKKFLKEGLPRSFLNELTRTYWERVIKKANFIKIPYQF